MLELTCSVCGLPVKPLHFFPDRYLHADGHVAARDYGIRHGIADHDATVS